jgi:hypothetical protein
LWIVLIAMQDVAKRRLVYPFGFQAALIAKNQHTCPLLTSSLKGQFAIRLNLF